MNQNFLLNILENIGNTNLSDSSRIFRNNRSRRSHRIIIPRTKEDNDTTGNNDSYDKMVRYLYKQTLTFDQTIINQEEHNDLIDIYNELISPKTQYRSNSNNHTNSSNMYPVSVYYEYRNNDGSSVSFSSNSSPLMTGMMSNISYSDIQNDNNLAFSIMDPFNLIPNMDNILESFLRNFTDTGEKLDPLSTDIFDTFKEVEFSDLKNHTKIEISDNCSICLSGFTEENKKALIMPCGHYFHKPCIKEWLTKYHYKCPICKRSCDPSRDNNDEKPSEPNNYPNNDVNNNNDDLYDVD